MENALIGRKEEQKRLESIYNSGKNEFVAVYGRRRVGKTFLIKEFFHNKFDFYFTGIYQATKTEQLREFTRQLSETSNQELKRPSTWFDAFALLKKYLETLADKQRIVIFLDEVPWIDTPKSDFLKAFEYFWNSYGASQKNIMLIVCASATTWMRDKLFGNKGGLYNRMTNVLYLSPFSLAETEEYLRSRSIAFNRYQILETYM
ncbi:MAG: AAA family ATPase, partial [Bacteroidales bacterium]|nr:AAA family ATPase [Bacteroidales bacterium]